MLECICVDQIAQISLPLLSLLSFALPSTGIGPEQFTFILADGGYTGGTNLAPSTSQLNFSGKHGFI